MVAGSASWALLTAAVDSATDPRRRHLLSTVARHVEAEVSGNIDETLSTMVSSPRYQFWGKASLPAPTGARAVRAYYEALVDTGMNRLEFAVDRVLVDSDTVVTEGIFRHVGRGAIFVGIETDGQGMAIDAESRYLVEYRSLVLWPFDGDLIAGEVIYAGGDQLPARRLAMAEYAHLGR
jgi:hypothetical protein